MSILEFGDFDKTFSVSLAVLGEGEGGGGRGRGKGYRETLHIFQIRAFLERRLLSL